MPTEGFDPDQLPLFTAVTPGTVPASGGLPTLFLSADGTWKTVSGGSDPWSYAVLIVDFTTTLSVDTPVTELSFVPLPSARYEFEGLLYVQTATAAQGARPGLSWPAGLVRNAARVSVAMSATAEVMRNWNGTATANATAAAMAQANVDQLGIVRGGLVTGATPVGALQVTLAAETAGTTVRVMAGSFLKWRTY